MFKLTIPKFDPRIAADLRLQSKSIWTGLLCSAINAALTGVTIMLVGWTVKVVEDLSRNARTPLTAALMGRLIFFCFVAVGLYALRYLFARGQSYFLSRAANRLAADLRIRLFRKLQRLPVSFLASQRLGALQSVLTNDVNVYQNAVGVIRDSIDGPIKIVVATTIVVSTQWQLGLMALLLVPLMGSIINQNSRKMRAAQSAVQDDLARVGAVTQELLQGARVVKAFGAERRTGAFYEEQVDLSFASQMHAAKLVSKLKPFVEFIGAITLALFLYVCGLLASQGQLYVADVFRLAMAMDTINQGFKNLAGLSNTFSMVQASNDRIYSEILDAPEQHELPGGSTMDCVAGHIEFRGVTFRYPDGTEALRQVSFVIEPGTSLALVGPSGAGKTTIADLLLRFYEPTEGAILLDGVDIRKLDIAWLRAQIGVVPQQTFLFAGSIEDNLRLAKPDATAEEISEALWQAHADQFTAELASRLDSELGERGTKLSGGQMQRVAIARALVRKPSILLLDEATSALDAASEKIVTDALDEIMKTRTTLFIAHRLTTAARADRILVLSKGQVVESGSHSELIEQNGAYAGLFRAFSGGVLEA